MKLSQHAQVLPLRSGLTAPCAPPSSTEQSNKATSSDLSRSGHMKGNTFRIQRTAIKCSGINS